MFIFSWGPKMDPQGQYLLVLLYLCGPHNIEKTSILSLSLTRAHTHTHTHTQLRDGAVISVCGHYFCILLQFVFFCPVPEPYLGLWHVLTCFAFIIIIIYFFIQNKNACHRWLIHTHNICIRHKFSLFLLDYFIKDHFTTHMFCQF